MHPQDTLRKISDMRTHYQQNYKVQVKEEFLQMDEDEAVKPEISLSASILNLGRKAVKTISDFTTRTKGLTK